MYNNCKTLIHIFRESIALFLRVQESSDMSSCTSAPTRNYIYYLLLFWCISLPWRRICCAATWCLSERGYRVA